MAALRISEADPEARQHGPGSSGGRGPGAAGARRLTEQGQELLVLLRQEVGAFTQTSRRIRRKLVRGVDSIEAKLADLETLYDLVHDEVEDTALDVAAALRTVAPGQRHARPGAPPAGPEPPVTAGRLAGR